MSSSTKSVEDHLAEMTLFEKIDTVRVRATVLANVFVAMFTSLLRGQQRKPPTYFRYIAYTAFRTMTRTTTLKQQHYMQLNDEQAYQLFCKKYNVKPASETLADGTVAYWIGDKTASKIIVNFHGGGYVLPVSFEMFKFMADTRKLLSEEGKDVAVLFLSYDLAPKAKYPRQLTQASALVSHLINNLSKKPSDIIFTGDSAGANLITQLFSHISHPHPSVPALHVSEKFRGVCLISPWINFDITTPSFKNNEYRDIIGTAAGTTWSSAFMQTPWPHSDSTDYYNQAGTAPKGWWNDIMTEQVLILGGEHEVLIDGIKKFGETMKEAIGDRCTTIYLDGEMHDQPNIDLMIGFEEPGETAKAIRRWLSSKL